MFRASGFRLPCTRSSSEVGAWGLGFRSFRASELGVTSRGLGVWIDLNRGGVMQMPSEVSGILGFSRLFAEALLVPSLSQVCLGFTVAHYDLAAVFMNIWFRV